MNIKDKILSMIRGEISTREKLMTQVEGLNLQNLDITAEPQVWEGQIDFNHLPHEQIIELIKAVGGKWDKVPTSGVDGKIDYSTEVNGLKIRCWAGQPPPNCKLVEVLETIPDQPERIVTRMKLQCV